MSDALTAAPEGPQTDTLVEQTDAPREAVLTTSEEPKKSLDDTLRSAVEKVIAEPKDKPKEKPDGNLKAEDEKPEPEKAEKVKTPVAEKPAQAAEDEAREPVPEPPKKPTAYKEAPHGFDDAAKKEWEAVPESVRGAMHRRAQEMERGIHKYRQDAEQFDAVRQFAEMAKQGGTDLATSLHHYTSMEAELRRDPISGLQQIVANLGLKGANGQPATLRDIAAHILGQPANQAASRQEAQISQLTQQVQSLKQQLGGFSKHMETQQQEAKVSSASNEWTAFQRENPRATELEPRIAEFLTKYPADIPAGERLRDAYNWAVAQNPSVAHTDPQPLAQTQTPNRQPNPAGQKSVSGTGGESRTVRKISSDEALKKAIAKIIG
jgi:hypothetical protein